MKRVLTILICFIGGIPLLRGQSVDLDSLKNLLITSKKDTNHVNLLLSIADAYYFTKPDSCLYYAEQARLLASELDFARAETIALNTTGEALRFLGEYPQALKKQFEALRIYRENDNKWGEARTLGFIGFTYIEFGQYHNALPFLFDSYEIAQQIADKMMSIFILSNTGYAYGMLAKHDSALQYQLQAYSNLKNIPPVPPLESLILTRLGLTYANLKRPDSAFVYYRLALQNEYRFNDRVNPSKTQIQMAELYTSSNMYDSSLYYARRSFASAKSVAQKFEMLQSSNLLARLYRSAGNTDSALFYSDMASAIKDSLYGPHKFRQLQLLVVEEQNRQYEIEQERRRIGQWRVIASLGAVILGFLVIMLLQWRNSKQKKKANLLLLQQKEKLESTLSELKTTQTQLIQSEKMASLGELTAGIAHEIQNPLNFVNNFSDVNTELVDELQSELATGNTQSAIEIAESIKDNEQKINHHGKRADAIVKGMLQHSRASSGQKEPTDINALADEYLRLAYHGMRAKDKSFNAITKTEFDDRVGKINIVPQEIGRVILNLINNAFYASSAKALATADSSYQPTVTVGTAKHDAHPDDPFGRGKIEISVRDNGNGIPQKIVDKIFQPFFTTKPTGQGTGLGLSLSYDIVKAHGGEITVETKDGESSTFTIWLPINKS